jgi:gliding motility-associated-like protein
LKIPTDLEQPFGAVIKGSDELYHLQVNGVGITKLYKSADGLTWTFQSIISENIPDISETCIAYIGKGRMIALGRQEADANSSYYMLRSENNGNKWQYVGRSGMNRNKTFVNKTAPYVVWDSIQNLVFAISTERNKIDALNDSIHVYIVNADNAYNNIWKEKFAEKRPAPVNTITYGYPQLIRLSSGNWTGIFTELTGVDDPEEAMFYQFDINYLKPNNCNTNPRAPEINITASSVRVCYKTPVTFYANPKNEGNSAVYYWKVNGINKGANNPWFTSDKLTDKDIISCIMVGNDTCVIQAKAISNRIVMEVDSLPQVHLYKDYSICKDSTRVLDAGSGYLKYLWNTGSIHSQINVNTPGMYKVTVMDTNGCMASDSTIINQVVNCPRRIFFPNAFTPNGDNHNDGFGPHVFGNLISYRFKIFDRWGKLIFISNDPAKLWDGKGQERLNNNMFGWVCEYRFMGEKVIVERGIVIMLK